MLKKIKVISRFQSTFPRGERRWQYTVTRGVSDFNPRSLVGNDYTLPSFIIQFNYFNPRSLVGNDDSTYDFCALNSISIHVPSWGTTHRRILPGAAKKFQSTFPRGERRITARIGDMPPLFQSTFPRGERR